MRFGAVVICCLAVANCGRLTSKVDPKYGVSASRRVVQPGQPVPKGGGVYRVGKPYVVAGRTYVPREDPNYSAVGLASWYGDDFHGRQTANGEIFDMHSISAAHPTLPIPSYVRVTNLSNRRSLIVRVNDRGPFVGDRIIDLSYRTAKLLGFHGHGLSRVKVEYVGRAPLEGSDDRLLLATLRRGSPAPKPGAVRLASARPFVPGYRRSRGPVPVPGERPFTLGESDTVTAPTPPSSSRVAVDTQSLPAPKAASKANKLRTVPVSVASSTSRNAENRPTVRPGFDTRWAAAVPPSGSLTSALPAPAAIPRPVSAYAPARYDSAPGYMSGRGLY